MTLSQNDIGDDMKLMPNIKTPKDCKEEYWNEFRDKFLENHIENLLLDYDDRDEDTKKSIRSKANTDFANVVLKMRSSFIEECKAKGEIWDKDEYPYNRHWIVDDPEIKKTIERYPKLLEIINFIDKESRFVISADGMSLVVVNKDWHEKRQFSYLIVDKTFYERAEKKLGLKQITMQKYLQAFCKIGILNQTKGHKLQSRAMVYSDGYYRSMKTGIKKEHWMKQSKHKKALRKFSYGN